MDFKNNVKEKIEDFTSEKINSIDKIGSGDNNAVYLVKTKNKKYALKIRERGLYDFFENELKALEILDGYVAPQLYYHDFSNPEEKFMLIEFINGSPIKSVNEIGINELVTLVTKIHERTKRKNTITKNFEEDLQWYLNEKCYSSVPELQKISFSKTAELIATCDMALQKTGNLGYSDPEHEVLIHGDLNAKNIIKDYTGKWRLIDWELSRYTQVETEIAALIWEHCNSEAAMRTLLNSDLCTSAKRTISLMTLVRGLDVACWRTKWINSLSKADEKVSFYHSELEEDWSKIRIFKEYV